MQLKKKQSSKDIKLFRVFCKKVKQQLIKLSSRLFCMQWKIQQLIFRNQKAKSFANTNWIKNFFEAFNFIHKWSTSAVKHWFSSA